MFIRVINFKTWTALQSRYFKIKSMEYFQSNSFPSSTKEKIYIPVFSVQYWVKWLSNTKIKSKWTTYTHSNYTKWKSVGGSLSRKYKQIRLKISTEACRTCSVRTWTKCYCIAVIRRSKFPFYLMWNFKMKTSFYLRTLCVN